MTRAQIVASALGAFALALGPAASADVTTTTTPIGTEGCSVAGCGRPRNCRGWCELHYRRWRTHGDALVNKRLRPVDFETSVRQRVTEGDPDKCWPWRGTLSLAGYGVLKRNRKQYKAHRVVYELLVGPISEGLTLDHLCRNRICVNPAHLEPVTLRENSIRGYSPMAINARKTHCAHGHSFDERNTRIYRHRRYCRACDNDRSKRRRALRSGRAAVVAGLLVVAMSAPAGADVVTITEQRGPVCHTVWADSETGAVLGWGDSPSQPCDLIVIPDFTPVVIDTGDGIATTGRTEADACLADGSCVEVVPGLRVDAGLAPAVSEWLIHTAVTTALDAWFWSELADCESGGRWDLVQRGRRPSGGLQIVDSTWRAYGGLEFAARAGLASQAEQIIVGRRILDAEGIRPWGRCGRAAS